jgi:ferredoxin
MIAYVNQNICIFCGMCGGICSDIFVIDSDKRKSIALDIELTDQLLALARHAEAVCPVGAIEIKDVPRGFLKFMKIL